MPNSLAKSLQELSDALEHLAAALERQPSIQVDGSILKELNALSRKIDGQATASPASPDLSAIIRQKHKRGFIKNWLQQRNMPVAHSTDSLRAEEYLFKAVAYLSQNFTHLENFYSQLKYRQSLKKNFTYTSTKTNIKYIGEWCTMLQAHKLIDGYKVNDDNIFIDLAELHLAIHFIYGYWLEILLRMEVGSLIRSNLNRIHSFDVCSGVHVLKPDGNTTELDLLAMVNDKVFWFECKSGDISSYFKKFAQHRKLMKLPTLQSFLVIPSPNPQISLQALSRSGMGTIYGSTLASQLEKQIL